MTQKELNRLALGAMQTLLEWQLRNGCEQVEFVLVAVDPVSRHASCVNAKQPYATVISQRIAAVLMAKDKPVDAAVPVCSRPPFN